MIKFSWIFCVCLIWSCSNKNLDEYHNWRDARFQELAKPYGWPSLIGLFPLNEGPNTIGKADSNDIILINAPENLGSLEVNENSGLFTANQGIQVLVDGSQNGVVEMRNDLESDGPTLVHHNSLQMYIIERDKKLFLRVKDTLSSFRHKLTGIPAFEYDPDWIIQGKVVDTEDKTEISYQNILGMTITNPVSAAIQFRWNSGLHTLWALENDESSYFIMVNDLTTGGSTYGGGRYIYPAKANEEGEVILDFNKLINPPCVFTPYATCPLPPKENHLPFGVLAGEKDFHLY